MKVISHGSQDAASKQVVRLDTMVRALPRIHKYDCNGAIHVLAFREDTHFPELPKDGLPFRMVWLYGSGSNIEKPSMRCTGLAHAASPRLHRSQARAVGVCEP